MKPNTRIGLIALAAGLLVSQSDLAIASLVNFQINGVAQTGLDHDQNYSKDPTQIDWTAVASGDLSSYDCTGDPSTCVLWSEEAEPLDWTDTLNSILDFSLGGDFTLTGIHIEGTAKQYITSGNLVTDLKVMVRDAANNEADKNLASFPAAWNSGTYGVNVDLTSADISNLTSTSSLSFQFFEGTNDGSGEEYPDNYYTGITINILGNYDNPAPAPAPLALLGFGLLGFGLSRRRAE